MDYSETDDSGQKPMEPMPQIEPIIEEPKEAPQNEIPADIIEISREATNNILQNVEKQPSKYWHFQFKNDKEKENFTAVLTSVPGYKLTVEYGIKQDTPDITLMDSNENIVGKIHLLLCDRRDTNNREKYYCKIYFYHFKNPKMFEDVKAAVLNFFENFKGSQNNPSKNNQSKNNQSVNTQSMGGKRKRRTYKKKRMNKKKTHRRK